MKILQLCNKPPLPAVDGGCIAMHNVTQGLLQAGYDVKIIAISTYKHPFNEEDYDSHFLIKTRFEAVYVDTKVNIIDAFSSLVTSDNYNVSRFFSTDVDKALITTLQKEQFDIVHLESLFMTPYIATIRRLSMAKIVLRSHNLEYIIWRRMAGATGNIAKKVYLKYLAKQLKRYEMEIVNQVDGVAAISQEDASKYAGFGVDIELKTIPFGIDIEDYQPTDVSAGNEKSLFHLGAMDWKPNIEGVLWFAETVYPTLNEYNLHLAGRKMPQWLIDSIDPKIHNHGEVIDALAFMDQFPIMIVPLFSAGGMRVKIIEGMAMKKAIISTAIGAEGINVKDRENIMIANTKEEFIEAITELTADPLLVKRIQDNGRRLVEREYNNSVLADRLIEFYKVLLS